MNSDTYAINEHPLVKAGYIPLDKSYIIRMVVLDMTHNKAADSIAFIKKHGLDVCGEDIYSAYETACAWNTGGPIPVGKAGTLLRLSRFASWYHKTPKVFIMDPELENRHPCNDPSIVDWPIERLKNVPGDPTGQWVSAALLIRGPEPVRNPDPKQRLTNESREHWYSRRVKGSKGLMWEPRYDPTILRQAVAFLELLYTGQTEWTGTHSEDFGPAKAFERISGKQYITVEQETVWKPKLEKQESDRPLVIRQVLDAVDSHQPIVSNDHRMVYSAIMYGMLNYPGITLEELQIANPRAMNKSWPESLKFFGAVPGLDSVVLRKWAAFKIS